MIEVKGKGMGTYCNFCLTFIDKCPFVICVGRFGYTVHDKIVFCVCKIH